MSEPYGLHEHDTRDAGEDGHRSLWAVLGGLVAYWMWRRWSGAGRAAEPRDDEGIRRGHRPEDDTNVRLAAALGGALVFFLAAVFGLVALLMSLLTTPDSEEAAADVTESRQQETRRAPQLQSDPSIELNAVRSREDTLLQTYRWLRRADGTVRIPIDRAMALFAGQPRVEREVETVHMATESGYLHVIVGQPLEPGAEPYIGTSPETYTISPEFAEVLDLIRVDEPADTLEGRSTIDE